MAVLGRLYNLIFKKERFFLSVLNERELQLEQRIYLSNTLSIAMLSISVLTMVLEKWKEKLNNRKKNNSYVSIPVN